MTRRAAARETSPASRATAAEASTKEQPTMQRVLSSRPVPRRAPAAIGLGLLVLVGLAGCSSAPEALPPCDPADEAIGRAFCGLMNPEDLALWPGRGWLIVSEMSHADGDPEPEAGAEAAPGPEPGRLTAIRLADGARRRLHPPEDASLAGRPSAASETVSFGDPSCPGPPDPDRFAPHGIDVGVHRASGVDVLAVVNHGGREAVEVFELVSAPRPGLAWRGCVPMPEGIMTNDVAWHPDGGFVVTNFMPGGGRIGLGMLWTAFEITTGGDTGSVLRWRPGEAVSEIPGSEGSAPNGVAVSRDGSEVFVAEWGDDAIYRLRLDGEGPTERDQVDLDHSPDNLTWMRDGRLLAAGQAGGLRAVLACSEIETGGCGLEHGVYAIDPVSLEANLLFEGLGAASVALEVDSQIAVGYFAGDHVRRVPRTGGPGTD